MTHFCAMGENFIAAMLILLLEFWPALANERAHISRLLGGKCTRLIPTLFHRKADFGGTRACAGRAGAGVRKACHKANSVATRASLATALAFLLRLWGAARHSLHGREAEWETEEPATHTIQFSNWVVWYSDNRGRQEWGFMILIRHLWRESWSTFVSSYSEREVT